MSTNAIAEVAELMLVVACLYFAIGLYVLRGQPAWIGPLSKRRRAVMLVLALAAVGFEVGEDVLDGASGPIDRALLLFVHERVTGRWIGFFETITLTGSSQLLVPLGTLAIAALAWRRHVTEAKLLALSLICGALTVYTVKLVVGRERPDLWETEWYWGASFPSGHTLAVATFATGLVVCIRRIRPRLGLAAGWMACVWIALVGVSRLVLGVHWPTDVLVAACMGVSVPLLMCIALDLQRA